MLPAVWGRRNARLLTVNFKSSPPRKGSDAADILLPNDSDFREPRYHGAGLSLCGWNGVFASTSGWLRFVRKYTLPTCRLVARWLEMWVYALEDFFVLFDRDSVELAKEAVAAIFTYITNRKKATKTSARSTAELYTAATHALNKNVRKRRSEPTLRYYQHTISYTTET